ncbi:MAG: transglycosylase SLT domain-containing protein, partial [Candidatus Omnitrophica bacterium]|nr:transglycosylase SLT domain-containing protein [Candidatus Omnitrophota bacterium]
MGSSKESLEIKQGEFLKIKQDLELVRTLLDIDDPKEPRDLTRTVPPLSEAERAEIERRINAGHTIPLDVVDRPDLTALTQATLPEVSEMLQEATHSEGRYVAILHREIGPDPLTPGAIRKLVIGRVVEESTPPQASPAAEPTEEGGETLRNTLLLLGGVGWMGWGSLILNQILGSHASPVLGASFAPPILQHAAALLTNPLGLAAFALFTSLLGALALAHLRHGGPGGVPPQSFYDYFVTLPELPEYIQLRELQIIDDLGIRLDDMFYLAFQFRARELQWMQEDLIGVERLIAGNTTLNVEERRQFLQRAVELLRIEFEATYVARMLVVRTSRGEDIEDIDEYALFEHGQRTAGRIFPTTTSVTGEERSGTLDRLMERVAAGERLGLAEDRDAVVNQLEQIRQSHLFRPLGDHVQVYGILASDSTLRGQIRRLNLDWRAIVEEIEEAQAALAGLAPGERVNIQELPELWRGHKSEVVSAVVINSRLFKLAEGQPVVRGVRLPVVFERLRPEEERGQEGSGGAQFMFTMGPQALVASAAKLFAWWTGRPVSWLTPDGKIAHDQIAQDLRQWWRERHVRPVSPAVEPAAPASLFEGVLEATLRRLRLAEEMAQRLAAVSERDEKTLSVEEAAAVRRLRERIQQLEALQADQHPANRELVGRLSDIEGLRQELRRLERPRVREIVERALRSAASLPWGKFAIAGLALGGLVFATSGLNPALAAVAEVAQVAASPGSSTSWGTLAAVGGVGLGGLASALALAVGLTQMGGPGGKAKPSIVVTVTLRHRSTPDSGDPESLTIRSVLSDGRVLEAGQDRIQGQRKHFYKGAAAAAKIQEILRLLPRLKDRKPDIYQTLLTLLGSPAAAPPAPVQAQKAATVPGHLKVVLPTLRQFNSPVWLRSQIRRDEEQLVAAEPGFRAVLSERLGILRWQLERLTKHECFLAGTRITLADGTSKPIEQVQVGERVRAFDPETGELTASQVVRTLTREVGAYYEVHLASGQTVEVTGEHPIFTPEGAFVKVKDLHAGQELMVDAAFTDRGVSGRVSGAGGPRSRATPPQPSQAGAPSPQRITWVLSPHSARRIWKIVSNVLDRAFRLPLVQNDVSLGSTATTVSPILNLVNPAALLAPSPLAFEIEGLVPVAVISIERIRAPTRVYNLTASPTPTYFANGLAVHNKDASAPTLLVSTLTTSALLGGLSALAQWAGLPGSDVMPMSLMGAGWFGSGLALALGATFFQEAVQAARPELRRIEHSVGLGVKDKDAQRAQEDVLKPEGFKERMRALAGRASQATRQQFQNLYAQRLAERAQLDASAIAARARDLADRAYPGTTERIAETPSAPPTPSRIPWNKIGMMAGLMTVAALVGLQGDAIGFTGHLDQASSNWTSWFSSLLNLSSLHFGSLGTAAAWSALGPLGVGGLAATLGNWGKGHVRPWHIEPPNWPSGFYMQVTPGFSENVDQYPDAREELRTMISRLPSLIGKEGMHGRAKGLSRSRIGDHRLYYVYSETGRVVTLLAFSSKADTLLGEMTDRTFIDSLQLMKEQVSVGKALIKDGKQLSELIGKLFPRQFAQANQASLARTILRNHGVLRGLFQGSVFQYLGNATDVTEVASRIQDIRRIPYAGVAGEAWSLYATWQELMGVVERAGGDADEARADLFRPLPVTGEQAARASGFLKEWREEWLRTEGALISKVAAAFNGRRAPDFIALGTVYHQTGSQRIQEEIRRQFQEWGLKQIRYVTSEPELRKEQQALEDTLNELVRAAETIGAPELVQWIQAVQVAARKKPKEPPPGPATDKGWVKRMKSVLPFVVPTLLIGAALLGVVALADAQVITAATNLTSEQLRQAAQVATTLLGGTPALTSAYKGLVAVVETWRGGSANTLWGIARDLLKQEGVATPANAEIQAKVQEILKLNPEITNPELIHPGQLIRLSGAETVSVPADAAMTSSLSPEFAGGFGPAQPLEPHHATIWDSVSQALDAVSHTIQANPAVAAGVFALAVLLVYTYLVRHRDRAASQPVATPKPAAAPAEPIPAPAPGAGAVQAGAEAPRAAEVAASAPPVVAGETAPPGPPAPAPASAAGPAPEPAPLDEANALRAQVLEGYGEAIERLKHVTDAQALEDVWKALITLDKLADSSGLKDDEDVAQRHAEAWRLFEHTRVLVKLRREYAAAIARLEGGPEASQRDSVWAALIGLDAQAEDAGLAAEVADLRQAAWRLLNSLADGASPTPPPAPAQAPEAPPAAAQPPVVAPPTLERTVELMALVEERMAREFLTTRTIEELKATRASLLELIAGTQGVAEEDQVLLQGVVESEYTETVGDRLAPAIAGATLETIGDVFAAIERAALHPDAEQALKRATVEPAVKNTMSATPATLGDVAGQPREVPDEEVGGEDGVVTAQRLGEGVPADAPDLGGPELAVSAVPKTGQVTEGGAQETDVMDVEALRAPQERGAPAVDLAEDAADDLVVPARPSGGRKWLATLLLPLVGVGLLGALVALHKPSSPTRSPVAPSTPASQTKPSMPPLYDYELLEQINKEIAAEQAARPSAQQATRAERQATPRKIPLPKRTPDQAPVGGLMGGAPAAAPSTSDTSARPATPSPGPGGLTGEKEAAAPAPMTSESARPLNVSRAETRLAVETIRLVAQHDVKRAVEEAVLRQQKALKALRAARRALTQAQERVRRAVKQYEEATRAYANAENESRRQQLFPAYERAFRELDKARKQEQNAIDNLSQKADKLFKAEQELEEATRGALEELRQPRNWQPRMMRIAAVVKTTAATHGIKRALAWAVLLTESRGNPRAESSEGAYGLMQVQLPTAQDKIGDRQLTKEDLMDPADPTINVNAGVGYLNWLSWYFNTDSMESSEAEKLILAAYHEGPGAVERQLKKWRSGRGVHPTRLPYNLRYINMVMAYFKLFTPIFEEQAPPESAARPEGVPSEPQHVEGPPAAKQGPAGTDIGIASEGLGVVTRQAHEAFHRYGQFAEIIGAIAQRPEVGAERRLDGRYDLRRAVERAGGRIMIPTGELRLEPDGVLVVIDSRFFADHAGRDEFAVYARNESKARHEMTELRGWAAFAKQHGIAQDHLGTRLRDWLNGTGETLSPEELAERLRAVEETDDALHRAGLEAEAVAPLSSQELLQQFGEMTPVTTETLGLLLSRPGQESERALLRQLVARFSKAGNYTSSPDERLQSVTVTLMWMGELILGLQNEEFEQGLPGPLLEDEAVTREVRGLMARLDDALQAPGMTEADVVWRVRAWLRTFHAPHRIHERGVDALSSEWLLTIYLLEPDRLARAILERLTEDSAAVFGALTRLVLTLDEVRQMEESGMVEEGGRGRAAQALERLQQAVRLVDAQLAVREDQPPQVRGALQPFVKMDIPTIETAEWFRAMFADEDQEVAERSLSPLFRPVRVPAMDVATALERLGDLDWIVRSEDRNLQPGDAAATPAVEPNALVRVGTRGMPTVVIPEEPLMKGFAPPDEVSEAERQAWSYRFAMDQRIPVVIHHRALAADVAVRMQRFALARWLDIRARLLKLGLKPETPDSPQAAPMKWVAGVMNDPWQWDWAAEAWVARPDYYILGDAQDLAVDVVQFLLERERQTGVANLVEGYVLYWAIARSREFTSRPILSHAQIAALVTDIMQYVSTPGPDGQMRTPLVQAVRDFITEKAERHSLPAIRTPSTATALALPVPVGEDVVTITLPIRTQDDVARYRELSHQAMLDGLRAKGYYVAGAMGTWRGPPAIGDTVTFYLVPLYQTMDTSHGVEVPITVIGSYARNQRGGLLYSSQLTAEPIPTPEQIRAAISHDHPGAESEAIEEAVRAYEGWKTFSKKPVGSSLAQVLKFYRETFVERPALGRARLVIRRHDPQADEWVRLVQEYEAL